MLSLPACRERGSPPRPRLELADVFREYAGRLGAVGPEQARVIRDITRCRTVALGGHVRKCMACGYVEQSYNSCRNRHLMGERLIATPKAPPRDGAPMRSLIPATRSDTN